MLLHEKRLIGIKVHGQRLQAIADSIVTRIPSLEGTGGHAFRIFYLSNGASHFHQKPFIISNECDANCDKIE